MCEQVDYHSFYSELKRKAYHKYTCWQQAILDYLDVYDHFHSPLQEPSYQAFNCRCQQEMSWMDTAYSFIPSAGTRVDSLFSFDNFMNSSIAKVGSLIVGFQVIFPSLFLRSASVSLSVLILCWPCWCTSELSHGQLPLSDPFSEWWTTKVLFWAWLPLLFQNFNVPLKRLELLKCSGRDAFGETIFLVAFEWHKLEDADVDSCIFWSELKRWTQPLWCVWMLGEAIVDSLKAPGLGPSLRLNFGRRRVGICYPCMSHSEVLQHEFSTALQVPCQPEALMTHI